VSKLVRALMALAGGVLALGLALPTTSAAAPAAARGAPQYGIGLVNLHLHLPGYHVRVIVPQLASDAPTARRANASLRRSGARLVRQWALFVAHRLPGARGRHLPSGTFDVIPRLGLTAASPLLVNTLLPVLGLCVVCTGVQYWSSDAVLLPSGDSVDLYDVLFAQHRLALDAIARDIRRQYEHFKPEPNACTAQMRRDHQPAPSVASLVHGLVYDHDLALESNGLEVGYNQGYLYDEACGLSPFLIPYRAVLPFASTEGRHLIDSFVDEPSPWDRTGLPASAFPRPVAEALALVARRSHFPAEGPTLSFNGGLVPSVAASATANSYGVGYYPCQPAQPLNSPKLGNCVKANYDIWGGFGGQAYASHAKAVHALLACSPWTCESRVSVCPARSRHVLYDGVRVALCSYGQGLVDEVSWTRGTWTFIVTPTEPGQWQDRTAEIIDEERGVRLSPYPAVLQNSAGGDNDNTSIAWTVGCDDYADFLYFGGGLTDALSFRPFKF
jgi:hypothetical protein